MHLNVVLGIGEIRDLGTAEIVIVRLPEEKLIGFAVEMIRRMQLVALAVEHPVPPLLAGRTSGIRAVLHDEPEGDTFLVDVGALARNEAVTGLSGLSEESAPPSLSAAGDPPIADGAIFERERYLVARAGAPVAIPIRHIARIVKIPARVTALPRAANWVCGLFREAGTAGPLIDLRRRLGFQPTEITERARVLISGSEDSPLGFLVDGVEHLEWSAWRSDGARQDDMIIGVVSLPRLSGQSVLPLLDLTRCDAALDGPAPPLRS
jgi:chemotaxis signal transduction protein